MSEQPPEVDAADIDQATIDAWSISLADLDLEEYPDGLDVRDLDADDDEETSA